MFYLGDKRVDVVVLGADTICKAYLGDAPIHISPIATTHRYHEVEYLNLKQGQWFDTGFQQTADTSMFIEFLPTKNNVCNVATTYGKIISQSDYKLELRWMCNPDYTIMSPKLGNYVTNENVWIRAYWNINGKFWFERDGIMTTADVYSPKPGQEPVTDPSKKNIFINTGPNNVYAASGLYKRFTIYNKGVPVYDVIPCVDTETGDYGYYETVTREFLHESLGHTITGGPVLKYGRKFN